MSSNVKQEDKEKALPLLLAGPILRRAEPHRVCIWLATSKHTNIRAEIFRLAGLGQDGENKEQIEPIGDGNAESIRLGERLFVTLVIAYPVQSNKAKLPDSQDPFE